MDAVIRKFSRLFELSDLEKIFLLRLHGKYREIKPRTRIVDSGDSINHSYLLQDGWAMVYKDLSSGEQQILSFAIPGDFLGLFSIMLNRAEYSIETISHARICELHWEQMMELFTNFPRLAMAVCWYGARDQVMLREHVVRIGRQSAYNRIGHIFLELSNRLENIGLTTEDGFDFPVTQEMLANALGMTPIHINRTLKKLKQSGFIDMTNGCLKIINPEVLSKETNFDNAYLRYRGIPDEIIKQPDVTPPEHH